MNVSDELLSPDEAPISAPTVPTTSTAPAGGCSCGGGCGGGAPTPDTLVYAIGRIKPRYPTLGVEKEFLQAVGREESGGSTDMAAMYEILTRKEYRYLARSLCWVFSVEGVDTYLIVPTADELDLLIEALRPRPNMSDVDVLIGHRGEVAPPTLCNGLSLPIVRARQIYSFDVDGLLRALPRPEKVKEEDFLPSAEELLHRLMFVADNAGSTDEHRALNYLAVRYHAVYHKMAEMHANASSLASVEYRSSALEGSRRVVDVVFTFRNRTTDVEDLFLTRVDVTEIFPFLVRKISPYFRINS